MKSGRTALVGHWMRSRAEQESWQVAQANAERFPRQVVYSFDWIGNCIQWSGVYELGLLEMLSGLLEAPMEESTILDVGANIGNHTAFFARAGSRVIAFEPNPHTFELLALNTGHFPNVTRHCVAASGSTGSATLSVPLTNVGGASLAEGASDATETVPCRTVRLDELLDEIDACSVTLIKIDVEGHEAEALAGMGDLLEQTQAIVALESYSGPHQLVVEQLLRAAGYCHFYKTYLRRNWAWAPRLGGVSGRFMHGLESVILGVPLMKAHHTEVIEVPGRDYELLLASKHPLVAH